MKQIIHNHPIVSIIICSYNNASVLGKTIQHTIAVMQRGGTFLTTELIIINNNSTDATQKIVESIIRAKKSLCQIRLLVEKRQGISYARNRGIRESRAPYIVFVDDDTLLDLAWLKNAYHVLKHHEIFMITTGKVSLEPRVSRHHIPQMLQVHDSLWSLGIVNLGVKRRVIRNEFLLLVNNTLFNKKLFQKIDIFDTQFGSTHTPTTVSGAEDIDLFQRVIYANIPVLYEPTLRATHIVDSKLSFAYMKRRYYQNGREIALFRRKHAKVMRSGITFYMRIIFYSILPMLLLSLRVKKTTSPSIQWYALQQSFWRGYINMAKNHSPENV